MLGPAALPCLPSVWAKTALWVSIDPANLPSMLTLREETKLGNIPNICGVLENGWTWLTLSLYEMWVLYDFEAHAKAWRGKEHENRTYLISKKNAQKNAVHPVKRSSCKTQIFGNPIFSRKAYNALAHSSEMLRTRARQFHAHAPELGGLGAQCCPLLFDAPLERTSLSLFIILSYPLLQEIPRHFPNCRRHTQTAKHQTLTDWIIGWKRYWETQCHRTSLSIYNFPARLIELAKLVKAWSWNDSGDPTRRSNVCLSLFITTRL